MATTDSEVPLPPHSLEAEQSVIGGLLLDNEAWDRIADAIAVEDFYRRDHQQIFAAIVKQIEARKAVDVVTVYERLEVEGIAQQIGGLAYLAEIANNTPSSANLRRYAEIVREKATLRRLQASAYNILASIARPEGMGVDQIVDRAEASIFEVAQENLSRGSGVQPIKDVLGQVVDRVQALFDRDGNSGLSGTPTGLVDLDRLTSGLQDSDMIVVAGRPGMGKTTLALNVAEHIVLEERKPVAIFSMEMPATQLATRFIASIGRIDQSRLKSGQLTEDDWGQLTYALGRLHDAPLYIDETPALTPTELRTRCRRLQRVVGSKLGLVVIDYLQLMGGSSGKDSENRTQELSEISRSIKALAKELNCPIFALSQLNRSLENRANKRPVNSDLRESGAIEQDADIIMFIYRDELYNPDTHDKGMAELIIGKHRNGPTGVVRTVFRGENTRFENYTAGEAYSRD